MSLQALVAPHSRLMVRQKREIAELLTGFESNNRYVLKDAEDKTLGTVLEEGSGIGAWITRSFFKAARAAVLHIYDPQNQEIGRIVKPFRFWFWEVEVWDGQTLLGRAVRRFGLLRTRLELLDAEGRTLGYAENGLFKRWSFQIQLGGQDTAMIAKKWSGLGRELFTDADSFGVEFQRQDLSAAQKSLLLGATFLIDFVVFERSG